MYQAREQRLAKMGLHGDLTAEQCDTLHAIMLLRNRVGPCGIHPVLW